MQRGTVVIAKAGKEKGELFAVTDVLDDRYVLISDGRRRPIERPKKKNIIHLRRTDTVIGEISTNRQLRRSLNSCRAGESPCRVAQSDKNRERRDADPIQGG